MNVSNIKKWYGLKKKFVGAKKFKMAAFLNKNLHFLQLSQKILTFLNISKRKNESSLNSTPVYQILKKFNENCKSYSPLKFH